MHNTNSNTNPLSNHLGPQDWANQFVPLPPTEFPDEVSSNNFVNERPTMELGTPPTSPLNNANLPCLQHIAGADPFFTPPQTPPPSPVSSNPAADLSSTEQAPTKTAFPPLVEVIGQHAAQAPFPNVANATSPATPTEHQKAEVETMNQSDFNNTNADIHEYDLAMKVLPSSLPATTVVAAQGSIEPTMFAGIADATQSDVSSYWSQDNVSSFIPGVTPLEAYPVCQDFAEQISASGEFESIALTSIQLDQLLVTAANIQSDTALEDTDEAETSQSDENCIVATAEETEAKAEAEIESNVVQTQVDPFADDTFESTLDVSLVKTTNQNSQPTQPTAEYIASDAEIAATVPAQENAVEDTSPECLETQLPEPVVPEIPNLAARQLDALSASVPDAAETETADSQPIDQTPELPNEDEDESKNEIHQDSNSNELFESVEKSLSDLQLINQYESNANFSPATNAIDVLPNFETASVTLVEPEPANAVPQNSQQHNLAPTFQPIDLTAHLPSVQETQSRPPKEPEIAQDAPHVANTTTFDENSQQEPEVPALEPVELVESVQQTSLQATDSVNQQVQELEEPMVAQEAPDSEIEPESDFQVIQVDGNEGFDFLDLKAFDVGNATFLPGKIYLDDGATKFQIQYSNLNLAVFAGDFQVELT